MTLIAYHGREADKVAILAQLAAHREADDLVQGYGYWKDGKGCAVGCTLHTGNHMEYETRFGIPVVIAYLEDSIFEGLPVELARQWPERLMGAIRPGQDLSRVHWHLLHWLLTTPAVNPGIEHPLVCYAVRDCATLMMDIALGRPLDRATESAAKAALIAARKAVKAANADESAAWSAGSADKIVWSAAWSAASAASAARAAQRAARKAGRKARAARATWSAGCAAESAARAAWSAGVAASAASAAWSARSAAWIIISNRLIALIQSAPMARCLTASNARLAAGNVKRIKQTCPSVARTVSTS